MDIHKLDIQGHRGCRGLMPENSIPAFVRAMELGVTTLEMDVVISRDDKVVVSHEPWLSHELANVKMLKREITGLKNLTPEEIHKAIISNPDTNIYKLNYVDVEKFDCGSKPHPRFPEQERIGVSKPLLSDVFKISEQYVINHDKDPILYNIEIKRKKEHDGLFHPDMKTFADLVVDLVNKSGVKDRVTLQCFDIETLMYINKTYPEYNLVYLIKNLDDINTNLSKLDFTPSVYSPYFKLLNKEAIQIAHAKKIKVIPWTVNEVADMKAMIDLGVDGIISDYPDRLIEIANKLKNQ